MTPLTDAQMQGIVQWVQIGQTLTPIIITGVSNFVAMLKQAGVDPAVYASLQAIIDQEQSEADAEAAAHGFPRK